MLTQNQGIIQLSVSQMVELLSTAYSTLIQSNTPLRSFPSVMLWGPPGVGKSQGIRQIAAMIREQTGKTVCVTDVRLLLFNPVDLRGIPTANEDRTLAVWLRPKIFQMDNSEDVINILFLDEITAAPQSVQAAAYQITLDRTIGEHQLPENCIVIAAGNRVTDRSVAFHMPKALANRLCHIEIKGDSAAWHDWAIRVGIHPAVIGYLDYNASMLNGFVPAEDDIAFPTPRTWEMVSSILRNVSGNLGEVYPLIAGCVGVKTAASLQTWYEIYQHIPDVKEIFSGMADRPPERPELLYATVAAMADYARTERPLTEFKNSISYACKLPIEFRFRLFSDYYKMRHIRAALHDDPIFSEWIAYQSEEGKLL
ncbi:MAG: AAA family ATPase [Oscillospiraceae bacterium]|nr:AAA family ATPase [Oscillospiraceae bacterium]